MSASQWAVTSLGWGRTTWRRPWLRRALGSALLVVVVGSAWFTLFGPRYAGGRASYVMVSGNSMEPSLSSGDLVVAHRRASYAKGDVVAYRVPDGDVGAGQLVIHRIIGGSAHRGYVLQGDNRDTPDLWRPRPGDIDGKMWFAIPGGARWVLLLRTPFALAMIAGVIAFLTVLGREGAEGEALPPESGIAEVVLSGKCARCGRALTSPESVERGLGPKCAAQVG